MKDRPTEFRTKKGQRVFRRRIYNKKSSEPTYAQTYTYRVQREQGDAYFNLGKDKREASSTADEITAFLAIEGNTVEEALTRYSKTHRAKAKRETRKAELGITSLKANQVTVETICTRYAEVTSHLSNKTVTNNIHALRHIAAGILRLPKLGREKTREQEKSWRKKAGSLPISELTNEKVERFRQRELNSAKGNYEQLGKMQTTLNFYLRSARSVFSKKILHHYNDLELPDFIPLRDIPQLQEPTHRYHSKIDVGKLVGSASEELKPNQPILWIIFLLAFGAGLRRNEIDKLTREQIDHKNRRIWIKTTPYFRPKTKSSEDYVDVDENVMSELTAFLDSETANDETFVLPSTTASNKLRCARAFRNLAKWLRAHGVDSPTPLHTLRKEAGSMLFEKLGSIDKAAEFLRNDPRIAREHYVGRKERLEVKLPGLDAA